MPRCPQPVHTGAGRLFIVRAAYETPPAAPLSTAARGQQACGSALAFLQAAQRREQLRTAHGVGAELRDDDARGEVR